MFKLTILLVCFAAAASAYYVHYPDIRHTSVLHHPIVVPKHEKHEPHHAEPFDHHPKYKYAYAVHDEHTGDVKSHMEERHDDIVHGEYSLVDPDGYKRIVKYTVGPHTGFQATVHREKIHDHHHHHEAPVKVHEEPHKIPGLDLSTKHGYSYAYQI